MAPPFTEQAGGAVNNSVEFDFTGVAVVVTGGTSGIGHAIASGFADAGAAVTITGTRPTTEAYDTDLARFDYHQLQAVDPASVDALVASLDALDVLVNNAGANMPGGQDEWSPDGFADSVAINLVGPMRLTVGCRRLLFASELAGGASVVNLASMAAFRAQTIVPGYGSAKAGIVTLTTNLAHRWAPKGVRVNAIAPGVIETPMTAPMAAFPELLDAELARVPMGRMGTPDEIVGAALFLSSSASSYLTGHTLAVDGGYLAG
jgi:3-oxoacyl-[acyl-carrier protein] reductase